MKTEKYKTLFLWMLIPMILMQMGIYRDYWGDFTDNTWAVHIHYWSGTIWYSFLIIQPYFISQGQIGKHRTNGIIGMFLAGGVCLTALSMLHRDVRLAGRAFEFPERFGPFQPWFFYGVAAMEIVMIVAFGYAVIKSIIQRKEIENHAWWLVSTVFIIMMPALGRGIQNVYVDLYFETTPNVDVMVPIYITQFLIILIVILGAWKFQKFRHLATYLALGVNLFVCFLEPIGKSESVQLFLKTMIKG